MNFLKSVTTYSSYYKLFRIFILNLLLLPKYSKRSSLWISNKRTYNTKVSDKIPVIFDRPDRFFHIFLPFFRTHFIRRNFSSHTPALVNRRTVKTAFRQASKHYVQSHQSRFGYHVFQLLFEFCHIFVLINGRLPLSLPRCGITIPLSLDFLFSNNCKTF